MDTSGQMIATNPPRSPQMVVIVRELPQNPLNSGLGIIVICPDIWMPRKWAPTWMSRWKLGSMVRIKGLFHLVINGIYLGYNTLTTLLPTSWDIQVLLMAEIRLTQQLRLIVYPIIYRVLQHPR